MAKVHMYRMLAGLAVLGLFTAASLCQAGIMWFDETAGGKGYGTFPDLTTAYSAFMALPTSVIDFNDLPSGTPLSNQYADRFGVTFLNTAQGRYSQWSTIHNEDDAFVETLTGYDGSYMPDGDKVVLKFDNNVTGQPFTIQFKNPVDRVGAFFGMGVEGSIHSLSISLFGPDNTLVGQRNFESWLWEKDSSHQNYESFFAVTANQSVISRVEILNNATQDFANALVLDNLAFGHTPAVPQVPEPATAAFLILGIGGLILLNPTNKPI